MARRGKDVTRHGFIAARLPNRMPFALHLSLSLVRRSFWVLVLPVSSPPDELVNNVVYFAVAYGR